MLLLVTQGPRPANNVDGVRIVDVGDTGSDPPRWRVEEITSAKVDATNLRRRHMKPYHVVRIWAGSERVYFSRAREVPPCVRTGDGRGP